MPTSRLERAPASYAETYGSDSDEDMLAGPSPGLADGAKKRPGRPKSNEAKSQPKRLRGQDDKGAPKKGTTKRVAKKVVVKETQAADDLGEADEFEDTLADPASAAVSVPSRASAADDEPPVKKSRSQATSGKGQAKNAVKDGKQDNADSETEAHASSSLSRKAAASKKAPRPAKREVIPDTQPDSMDTEVQEAEHDAAEVRKLNKTTQQNTSKKRADAVVDRDSDGSSHQLQQQLSDMTDKFEALQAQYNELKEVGIDEAEDNYETLKQQMQERNKITDKIIAKLRSETAVAAEKTAEMARLQAEMKGLREAADATQAEKQKLQTSLEAAQAENKALQAKLSATRSTSEQAKTMPGSAVKGGPAARQAASAEAQKDIAKRKLKEELYGDLTDLIIRDVKRREETGEDVFDCFQTGRNGTLQFHLSIPNPPPADEAFADVEIGYEPMLDDTRDRQIIDVLPEFAREEICFQRGQAAKFYAQIREAMQKRVDQAGLDSEMQDGA